jgi:hypothetical protein
MFAACARILLQARNIWNFHECCTYISTLKLRKIINYPRRIFAKVLTKEELYKANQNVQIKNKIIFSSFSDIYSNTSVRLSPHFPLYSKLNKL